MPGWSCWGDSGTGRVWQVRVCIPLDAELRACLHDLRLQFGVQAEPVVLCTSILSEILGMFHICWIAQLSLAALCHPPNPFLGPYRPSPEITALSF